jgi:DNA polymerase III subunit delta
MLQKPEDVLTNLRQGKYAPVYFLQGEEPFFIDQITDFIENNALQDHEKGFNQLIIYGKEVDVRGILNQARSYPMMGERKVVIVKEAQEIKDLKSDDTGKLLSSYLHEPLASTILVFAHKHKPFDRRKSLGKDFEKHAVFVQSEKIKDYKLTEWVEKFVQSLNRKIEARAAATLVEFIGNNLDRLSGEIRKILINIKEGDTISEDMVHRFVGISKEYNVWELQKAISFRDAQKAFRIVQFFEANSKNNPAIPIITNLFNYYVKVLHVHKHNQLSDFDLAKRAGLPGPWAVGEYRAASRNFSTGKIFQNIHFLKEADMQCKGVIGANIPEGQILKELVFKLIN